MLKQAKAKQQKMKVHLQQMDIQNLEFADNTFDTMAASFVFCAMPDSIRGLMKIERAYKPRGQVVLLEHVLSANRILGLIMNLASQLVVRMVRANINRQTVENMIKGNLKVGRITELEARIFKLIEVEKN